MPVTQQEAVSSRFLYATIRAMVQYRLVGDPLTDTQTEHGGSWITPVPFAVKTPLVDDAVSHVDPSGPRI
jgi:hypothetical protein